MKKKIVKEKEKLDIDQRDIQHEKKEEAKLPTLEDNIINKIKKMIQKKKENISHLKIW